MEEEGESPAKREKKLKEPGRGTSKGFKGRMPVGGQHPPSSGVGARLEW